MRTNTRIFVTLIRQKLVSLMPELLNSVINVWIWVGLTGFVAGYLLQHFGMAQDFGPFQFAAAVGTLGLFEYWVWIFDLLGDIENDNVIGYQLTLPCSAHIVFAAHVGYYALSALMQSLAALPIGFILFWRQLPIMSVSWGWFALILLASSIFYGVFALWVATVIGSSEKIHNLWGRVLFPLWFLGGYQFSFAAAQAAMPWLAFLMLFNPMTYIMEGFRGAIIGGDTIPVWVCVLVLSGLCVPLFFDAVRRFRKQLDFVG